MKSKKAISLIVLIITIIVMIILASAIIMSLDNTNIFNKAEEAVEKTNAATNKYLSDIKLAERELEKIQGPSKVTDKNPGTLSGKGTTDEPYLIESIEDLVAFSDRVNGGESFAGETVKLTRLLDFNSDNSYVNPGSTTLGDLNGDGTTETIKIELTTGAGFTPIGLGETEQQVFKGTFDGDGAEIRNLYINNKNLNHVALFGCVYDGNITNLGVTGNIEGNAWSSGGIIGYAQSIDKAVSISNCYSKVSINVDKYAGTSEVGGILGTIQGDYAGKTAIIQDCYNVGKIISQDGGNIGGIVGLSFDTYINRCYNLGQIYSETYGLIGGIGGYVADSKVINTYNEGSVIGSDQHTFGLAGVVGSGAGAIIQNSYNAGVVKDQYKSPVSSGLIGDGYSTLQNCFNIKETGSYEISHEGVSEATNVYYIQGKQATLNAIDGLECLSLDVMKSQTFVETLNANIGDNTEWVRWVLGPNGYPTLDM